jgi:hypothetical protein
MGKVTESYFKEAVDDNLGWCTKCKDFTTGCCEPDAHRYECDECGKNSVYGAEEALLLGLITIENEPDITSNNDV